MTYLNNFVKQANIQNVRYVTGTNSLDQMLPFDIKQVSSIIKTQNLQ